MAGSSRQQAIDEQLTQLRDASPLACREIEQVLPQIRPHGDEVTLAWLLACRRLYDYDREAGKAFIRGSREAERVSETVAPWTEQALHFTRWRNAWRALEGFMANLPRAYGSLGHAGERRWAEIGFVWCERQVDSGCAYFTTPVVDLSGRQGITGIEQLTQPAEELYETRKLLLSTYLAGGIRVRNLLGAQAILPWALRGADVLQSGRARGEAYFRLESEESIALLLDQLPGFRLTERNRLLSMLLDVWYGHGFELKEGSWSPEKGRPFVETDGRSIYFPAVMPNRDEAVLATLHAAGHMRFGTFDRLAMKKLFGLARVDFPDAGPVSWAPLYARYGDDALRFQLIFDLCEDLRIDFRIQQLVPNYLQRLLATARSGARHPETGVYYGLAMASVEQALAALIDQYGNDGVRDERFAPLLDPVATVADAWRIADTIYTGGGLPPVSDLEAFHAAYLPGRGPNTTRLAHPQQDQDEQRQQTRSGAEGEKRPQDGGEEQSETPQNAESGDERDGGKRQEIAGFGDSSGASTRASGRSEDQRQNAGASDKGVGYPEWDYREARYKRNWAWVQERKLAESNITETNRLMNQVLVRAEAPEEGNPGAKADPACAAGAAARRRGHRPQRHGELRRGEAGGAFAQAGDLSEARDAPARDRSHAAGRHVHVHHAAPAGGRGAAGGPGAGGCAAVCGEHGRGGRCLFNCRFLLQVPRQRELLHHQGLRATALAGDPQPDRRHVGAARHAHGRRDPPRHRLLRRHREPAPAAVDSLRRPA